MAQTMTPCNQDLEFWRSPNCFHLRLYLTYFPLRHYLLWVLSLMFGSAMNVRFWIALQYTKVLLQVHVMQCNEYECQIGLTLLRQASSSAQSQTAANAANCCCNRRSCPATTAAATEGLPSPCIFHPPFECTTLDCMSNMPRLPVDVYKPCVFSGPMSPQGIQSFVVGDGGFG